MIWSSAKILQLMTTSQILAYKKDCKTLSLNPSKLQQLSLSDYFDKIMRPFAGTIKQKKLSIDFKYDFSELETNEIQDLNNLLCTDY